MSNRGINRRWRPLLVPAVALLLMLSMAGLFYAPFFTGKALGPSQWDWSSHALYMEHVRHSLKEYGEIPFFVAPASPKTTCHFATILEAPVYSPVFLLARWLDAEGLIKANFALLLLAGILGLFLLGRHLSWGTAAVLAIFPVIFTSGNIAPRLFIGHQSILPILLAPLALYFFLMGVDRRRPWFGGGLLAETLTYMLAAGGAHPSIWMLLAGGVFALSYAVFSRQWRATAAICFILVMGFFLLAAFRLFPSALDYEAYAPRSLYGYLSVEQILLGLTDRDIPWYASRNFVGDYHTVMWWELSFYVGWVFLAVFSVAAILTLAKARSKEWALGASALVVVLVMTCFAYGDFYFGIRELPLPWLSSQRHTTRFMLVGVVFAAFSVAHAMARMREKCGRWPRMAMDSVLLALTLYFFYDYSLATKQWRDFSGPDKLPYATLAELHAQQYLTATVMLDQGGPLPQENYNLTPQAIHIKLPVGTKSITLPGLTSPYAMSALLPSVGQMTMTKDGLRVDLPEGATSLTLSSNMVAARLGAWVSVATFLILLACFMIARLKQHAFGSASKVAHR